MLKFKDGDIVVRTYESGRCAVGLYREYSPHFTYLGENFEGDNGLEFLDGYGLGNEGLWGYKYRYPTYEELVDTIDYLEGKGFKLTDEYVIIVKKYMNKYRKYKLKYLQDKNN